MSKTDRSILITGCSSGIGLSAARLLQARGYQVIASCRQDADCKRLQGEGLRHVLQLDLSDSQSIRKAVEQTLNITQGQLFALFNNGAYSCPGAVEDLSRDALRRQFEVNVFGTHELTCLLLPTMLNQDDARIIQNSSVLGLVALPMRGAYNASKFALEGLTDTLRQELHNTSVKVCSIEPGPILTRFRQNALVVLEREIDLSASRHKDLYQRKIMRLQQQTAVSSFTLPPESVVDKVILALESRRPKPHYYVTKATYIMAILRRLLPTTYLDRLARQLAEI